MSSSTSHLWEQNRLGRTAKARVRKYTSPWTETRGGSLLVRRLLGTSLFLVLGWALSSFGATPEPTRYLLFLGMVALSLTGIFLFPREYLTRRPSLLLSLLGSFLFLQVLLQETIRAQGYLLLCLGWMALFVTLAICLESLKMIRMTTYLLVAAGILESIYGIVQSLGSMDYIGSYFRNLGRVATGTFINQNHYAGFLNLMIPLAVGLLLACHGSPRRRYQKSERNAILIILTTAIALMGLSILLSLSRGGSAVMMATFALIALLAGLRGKISRKKRRSSVVILLVALVVLSLGLWVGLDNLFSRFQVVESDLTLRLPIYQDTLSLIQEHPLTGVGPGMYVWAFRSYQQNFANKLYVNAHNDYLQTTAEWGIPAALLFWSLVFWTFYRVMKVFLVSKSSTKRGLALGCAGAIFSILLHSLVDFNLQIPANWMVFCIILGLAWSIVLLQPRKRISSRKDHEDPDLEASEAIS